MSRNFRPSRPCCLYRRTKQRVCRLTSDLCAHRHSSACRGRLHPAFHRANTLRTNVCLARCKFHSRAFCRLSIDLRTCGHPATSKFPARAYCSLAIRQCKTYRLATHNVQTRRSYLQPTSHRISFHRSICRGLGHASCQRCTHQRKNYHRPISLLLCLPKGHWAMCLRTSLHSYAYKFHNHSLCLLAIHLRRCHHQHGRIYLNRWLYDFTIGQCSVLHHSRFRLQDHVYSNL